MARPDPVADSLAAPLTAADAKLATQTPLAAALAQESLPATARPVQHCGALTPGNFGDSAAELDSLLRSAGISDLGWRGKILVTGSDRLRWLNGMVSNTVQSLPEGQGNYSLLLSVQGRIQGDCHVYRRSNDLLLDTGKDQVPALLGHLDHFVIMDDVELTDVSNQWTALSLAGPNASQVLAALGAVPAASDSDYAALKTVRIGETECVLIVAKQIAVPRFEIWCSPEQVHGLWETLTAAGAQACGLEATEALRVLEAIPLYGVDLNDRDLPQETGQTQALCFSKGCYLGQEIVERIRSRGKVNRQFRQFILHGSVPVALPADLQSGGQAVGRITSVATVMHGGAPTNFALGFARLEVLERDAEISYEGGVATAVAGPPALSKPASTSK